jgi:hypothetical protein
LVTDWTQVFTRTSGEPCKRLFSFSSSSRIF